MSLMMTMMMTTMMMSSMSMMGVMLAFVLKRLCMCVVDGGRVLLYCDEIERGARSYACCCRGEQAPIHRAAAKGHTSTVELLISKNADVNVQDE